MSRVKQFIESVNKSKTLNEHMGKLKDHQYDILKANVGRKGGEQALNSKGEPIKSSAILGEANEAYLTYITKNGNSYYLKHLNGDDNEFHEIFLTPEQIKDLKNLKL